MNQTEFHHITWLITPRIKRRMTIEEKLFLYAITNDTEKAIKEEQKQELKRMFDHYVKPTLERGYHHAIPGIH